LLRCYEGGSCETTIVTSFSEHCRCCTFCGRPLFSPLHVWKIACSPRTILLHLHRTPRHKTVTLGTGGQPHAESKQTTETRRKPLGDGPHFRAVSRCSLRVENMLMSLVTRRQALARTRRGTSSILRPGRQFHVSLAWWTRRASVLECRQRRAKWVCLRLSGNSTTCDRLRRAKWSRMLDAKGIVAVCYAQTH
jgi:hypothetical protein